MSMRVGLFGGTFDPMHLAHLRMACALRDELSLDRVHVVPAGVLGAGAVLAALPTHGFAVDHVHRPLTGAPFLTTAATSGTPGR